MSTWTVETPVALIIFNRPDTTARVLSRIAEVKPRTLLVIADGPRRDRPDDIDRCKSARNLLEDMDWKCEVLTNFADINMGCKRRVSSGLDWVFDTVEEAIILEDDCVPDPSFFRFCDEILARYRDDERIMMISGDNFQYGVKRGDYSYYFSRFCHIWGWATWARAWKFYDVDMTLWPEVQSQGYLKNLWQGPLANRRWSRTFDRLYQGAVDTWDLQWMFACWIQSGLSVMPNQNLVSNIGFRPDATHSTDAVHKHAALATSPIEFPLRHPPLVIRDEVADRHTDRYLFAPTPGQIARSIASRFGV